MCVKLVIHISNNILISRGETCQPKFIVTIHSGPLYNSLLYHTYCTNNNIVIFYPLVFIYNNNYSNLILLFIYKCFYIL